MINFGFKKKKEETKSSNTFKVKCSKCGKQYQLPFKPDSSKPSYCSECLKKERGENKASSKAQPLKKSNKFKAVCAECGKGCELPFQPKKDKPVYCDECFKKRTGQKTKQGGGRDQYKEQLNLINAKLDKVLNVLNRMSKVSHMTHSVQEVKAVPENASSKPEVEKEEVKAPTKEEAKKIEKVEKKEEKEEKKEDEKKKKEVAKKKVKAPAKKKTTTKKATTKKSTAKKTTAAKKKK